MKSKSNGVMYTPQEVCKILSICKKTLYNYQKEGKIPYFRDDRIVRYKASDIEEFINSKMTGGCDE